MARWIRFVYAILGQMAACLAVLQFMENELYGVIFAFLAVWSIVGAVLTEEGDKAHGRL